MLTERQALSSNSVYALSSKNYNKESRPEMQQRYKWNPSRDKAQGLAIPADPS
jgi:hypothetical protein